MSDALLHDIVNAPRSHQRGKQRHRQRLSTTDGCSRREVDGAKSGGARVHSSSSWCRICFFRVVLSRSGLGRTAASERLLARPAVSTKMARYGAAVCAVPAVPVGIDLLRRGCELVHLLGRRNDIRHTSRASRNRARTPWQSSGRRSGAARFDACRFGRFGTLGT
jgi:hypothetical protein